MFKRFPACCYVFVSALTFVAFSMNPNPSWADDEPLKGSTSQIAGTAPGKYTSNDGRFKVAFPSIPEVERGANTQFFRSETDGGNFMVVLTEFPREFSEASDDKWATVFEAYRDGSTESSGGIVFATFPVTHQGHRGLQYSYHRAGGGVGSRREIHVRLFHLGSDLYVVSANQEAGEVQKNVIDNFLNSFEFIAAQSK
jgi:hypothetical protein